MKSKPNNTKKGKSEASNLAPPGTPDNKSNASNASPAGSTSSTSSMMSIPPSRPVAGPSSAEGASGTTGPPSTSKASSSKSKVVASAGDKVVASTGPTYPILTHYNLADFPKINSCIVGNKGGSSTGTPNEANKPIENLTMDDLDTLQAELETLWSSVAARIRTVKREEANLQSVPSTTVHHNLGLEHFDPQHQEKIAAVDAIIGHGTRTSVSAAAKLVMGAQLANVSNSPVPSPSTSAQAASTSGATTKKASAKGERLPKKKLKNESGGIGKSKKSGDKPAARATQNRTHSVSSDMGTVADGVVKQHEIPNQFWDSVNEYCRDITQDDLDKLQGVMDEQRDLPEGIFDIPPLGKHFKDDEETARRKAREARINSTKDQVGPLTQRLVSALVDEKVAAYQASQQRSPNEDASTASASASGNPEGSFIHRPGLVKALGLDGGAAANAVPLESRIKDCLLQHGLLLPEDASANDDPDDEILAEIRRTQSLLKKLHQYNTEKLQNLRDVAKREMGRYEHQRQLDKADKDLLDAYKNMQACRLKKKPLSKKEKDAATKALEARKKALQKLDGVPPNTADDKGRSCQIMAGASAAAGAAPPEPSY